MDRTFIGIDFGSDSVRAVLVTEHGEILSGSVSNYTRWAEQKYCDPARSIFRQHPLDYLEGIEKVIREVLEGRDRSALAAIAVDTTGSTPCAVDADGTPLALLPEFADDPDAMFILWKDHSAQQEADRINEIATGWDGPDYRMYEGGIYSAEWFWSKLLHILKNNSRVRNAAASFVEHCDWISAELTGRTRPDMIARSRCAAGHKAMWHTDWDGLVPETFLTAVDPLLGSWRKRLYSATVTADKPVGTLSEKWARKLGLSTSVVIGGSAFDCHAGAVGAKISPGTLVKIIGTSTCDILVAPEVSRCIPGICGQVDGSVVPGMIGMEAGQSAFGDIYAWFKRLLEYAGPVSMADLERDALLVPPGAGGVYALDWFNGRRSPCANTALTGALLGLNLGSTAPMLYRALVESTVFGSRSIIEHFKNAGIEIKNIAAAGGISRKSPLVMQLCADILNMPVAVVKSEQTCALGSAIFAAAASGVFPDTQSAMAAMGAGIDMTYTPDPSASVIYNDLYKRYRETGAFLENLM